MIRTTNVLPLVAALCGFVGMAHAAPHASPQDLERLSQQNQADAPVSLGAPVTPIGTQTRATRPVPDGLVCKSPRQDFLPVYAQPDAYSPKIGAMVSPVAATTETNGRWTKILRVGQHFGWVHTHDLHDFTPATPTAPPHCQVAGEAPNGKIVFAYSR